MKNITLVLCSILISLTGYNQNVREIKLVSKMLQVMALDNGETIEFWGYGIDNPSGFSPVSLPGPVLEINKGDSVIINLFNDSPEDHTIHLHGLDVSQANDGVPSTSFAVPPKGKTAYKFNADYEGIFLYHCHVLTTLHLTMGMYGMIVVSNYPDSTRIFDGGPKFTNEYRFLTSDLDKTWNDNVLSIPPFYRFRANYFMVNGKSGNMLYNSFNDHVESYVGDTTVLRLGNMAYSQSKYIFPQELNAVAYMSDGRVLSQAFNCDTLIVNSGERYTVVLTPNKNTNDDILVKYYEARNGELTHTNRIRLNGEANISEQKSSSFVTFPNPANSIINFMTSNPGSNVKLFDLSGKLLMSKPVNSFTIKINLSSLDSGIYLIQYRGETNKLIKQ